ncbi:MAG: hypothetical protein IPK26_02285 [Planctomycetes bacterium]|nr:hypothetical protein [Planctomycetota bacterium]
MKKFLSFALAAALCAPAFAQKMGSSNSAAPSVEQTVIAGDAKMSLNYTSITWADGKTMTALMDKEKGARARGRVNSSAKDSPLGTFTTSVDVTCGDLKLAAGEYKVSFTISDNLEWEINFTGKDTQKMKLPLMDNPQESKRLLMCMYAGDDEGAGVYVAFGNKMCMLNFAPAKKA